MAAETAMISRVVRQDQLKTSLKLLLTASLFFS